MSCVTVLLNYKMWGGNRGDVIEVDDSPLLRNVLKTGRLAELVNPPDLLDQAVPVVDTGLRSEMTAQIIKELPEDFQRTLGKRPK